MKRRLNFFMLAIFILAFVPLQAQMGQEKQPGEALISMYQVAPGKHLEFLKWQASQEAVNVEAGVPATQWYAHMNGASWDYVAIAPVLTDAQEDKVDEIAKKKGMLTGPKAGLQFRQFISTHSDTYAAGPTTAADLLKGVQ